jgi:hypothetical protein
MGEKTPESLGRLRRLIGAFREAPGPHRLGGPEEVR